MLGTLRAAQWMPGSLQTLRNARCTERCEHPTDLMKEKIEFQIGIQ
jgi:hypothetical protein